MSVARLVASTIGRRPTRLDFSLRGWAREQCVSFRRSWLWAAWGRSLREYPTSCARAHSLVGSLASGKMLSITYHVIYIYILFRHRLLASSVTQYSRNQIPCALRLRCPSALAQSAHYTGSYMARVSVARHNPSSLLRPIMWNACVPFPTSLA